MTYSDKIKELREIAQQQLRIYKDYFEAMLEVLNTQGPLPKRTMEYRYQLFNNYQKAFANYNEFLVETAKNNFPLSRVFEEVQKSKK